MHTQLTIEDIIGVSKENIVPYSANIIYAETLLQRNINITQLGITLEQVNNKIKEKIELSPLETLIFLVLTSESQVLEGDVVRNIDSSVVSLALKCFMDVVDATADPEEMVFFIEAFYREEKLNLLLDNCKDIGGLVIYYGDYVVELEKEDKEFESKVLGEIASYIGYEEALRIATDEGDNEDLVEFIEELIANKV